MSVKFNDKSYNKLQVDNIDNLLKILKSLYLKSNDIIINKFIVDNTMIFYNAKYINEILLVQLHTHKFMQYEMSYYMTDYRLIKVENKKIVNIILLKDIICLSAEKKMFKFNNLHITFSKIVDNKIQLDFIDIGVYNENHVEDLCLIINVFINFIRI